MKKYQVTGVLTYAHVFDIEVEAKNQKEARDIAKNRISRMIDPAMAEYQEAVIDKPIEIKESPSLTNKE